MSQIQSSADAVTGSLLLIVDDVPANLAVLGDLLREAGYRVKAATSGPVALRYAAMEPQPELILLDVMMPEMDGPATLLALRQLPNLARVPVVFMTAKVQPQEVANYRALGAADVIAKPFDPMTLADQVRAIWLRHAGKE